MKWSLLSLLLVALMVTGCGKGGFSERAQVGKENILRYPIVTNPTSLDPGVVQDGDTLDLIQQMYEGLVTWSEENEPVGAIAESWEISEDGRVYTFKIKEGVKFHNGREVTAEDVKWSFERNTNPALASQTAEAYLSDIVGINEKVSGRASEVTGVQVVDDRHVQITLLKPTPYFLGKLTYLVSAVMAKEATPEGEISNIDQIVGTGPFKITSYQPEQLIVLERFDDYHGGTPLLEGIERPVIKDPVTRLNKYKTGELDLVMLERQDIEGIQSNSELAGHLQYFNRPSIWYVALNSDAFAPFADRRVRQAVAMAIDKEKIVNELLGGVNEVANSIVPRGVPGFREDTAALEFNPARARELLAEAGYPNGQGFPALNLTFREARPDIKIASEAVASMLKQNLNIDIRLQTMEWRAFLERYNSGDHEFVHMRWAADYLDPQNFLSHMLATFGPENKIGYDSPEFDRLCRQADSILDMDERLPLYNRAEDIALNDAIMIPIYFQRDVELHRPYVQGLRLSAFGHLPHTTVQLNR